MSYSSQSRNIVIFSDGTGQRGGIFFDEARTNVYKLYRASRPAPDSTVSPDRQLAFYDPGLGSQASGGGFFSYFWRAFYNFVSQATGLGITQNIIDCYAAIIQLWRPGDRIFLFGFSRGAYTVRCLASALCHCGIPTQRSPGKSLLLDAASARQLAAEAVKSVYQHVSSPRDEQFVAQRSALAKQFRERHACSTDETAYPFFIGVFDTVAALSNLGSLAILAAGYVALLALASFVLALSTMHTPAYWAAWLAFDTFCLAGLAYVYTHLKFSFSLSEFKWWETVHLTTFRQKFYDQDLNAHIGYARHAISIDEKRSDFARVRWGSPLHYQRRPKMEQLEQIWFAGNHADIGGGYAENESRLSDISLQWMIEAASDKLADEGLIVDRNVLNIHPSSAGMQHDETRSIVFRFAGTSVRDPVPDATLHQTVVDRFNREEGVLQYDVTALYRPEALRNHQRFPNAYDNIPLPYQTCWQRVRGGYKSWRPWTVDANQFFQRLRAIKMDKIVSCFALAILVVALFAGGGIILWQGLTWLQSGAWPSMPLDTVAGSIRKAGIGWSGLQMIYDWLLALPLSAVIVVSGFIAFRVLGGLSAYLYRKGAKAENKQITPAQTRA